MHTHTVGQKIYLFFLVVIKIKLYTYHFASPKKNTHIAALNVKMYTSMKGDLPKCNPSELPD